MSSARGAKLEDLSGVGRSHGRVPRGDVLGRGALLGSASATITGIKHFLLEHSAKNLGSLPRCARAIKGWEKLAPSAQQLPMPRVLALAVAEAAHGVSDCPELRLLLAPVGVHSSSLVAPRQDAGPEYATWGLILHDATFGLRGRTGMTDESVTIDLDSWLWRPLAALHSARPANQPLWPFDLVELRNAMTEALDIAGAKDIGFSLYSLRHGGASDDLLGRRRSLEQVKAKGRWRSDHSLMRYATATRLQKEMNRLEPAIVALGTNVEIHFAKVITAANNTDAIPFGVPSRVAEFCQMRGQQQ
jgi:hypothetical protein